MPLREREYVLGAEEERLLERLEDIADDAVGLDESNPEKQRLLREGQQLDAQLEGVRWAMGAHDDDAVGVWNDDVNSVTLGGLTGGEFGKVEDELTGEDVAGGATRVYMVAEGTVDAPYLPDGGGWKATIGAVGQLPLPYLKWAEARIDDLSGVGDEGNGTRFGDLLADRRAEPTSADE
jgi:hypothetical protein